MRPRWCSGHTTRLPPRRTGFDFRRGRSQILACGDRAGRFRWPGGFSRGSPVSPHLHSGAVACSSSSALKTSMLIAAQITPRQHIGAPPHYHREGNVRKLCSSVSAWSQGCQQPRARADEGKKPSRARARASHNLSSWETSERAGKAATADGRERLGNTACCSVLIPTLGSSFPSYVTAPTRPNKFSPEAPTAAPAARTLRRVQRAPREKRGSYKSPIAAMRRAPTSVECSRSAACICGNFSGDLIILLTSQTVIRPVTPQDDVYREAWSWRPVGRIPNYSSRHSAYVQCSLHDVALFPCQPCTQVCTIYSTLLKKP
ncbi:hypothetical protein PR048_025247 [Dryococelus australis]|uniref:Uncharacterized protein n=1 Tax=Dryococelus australis TaxID=614101 RepID=A0ABQ9GQV1_9NEOP|nr:hypothetical protein PR048_025247 [Dryococelus australis]